MKGKKGMELSINMLVVIVLGVILLSLGIVFMNKIVSSGSKLTGDISNAVKEEIRQGQFSNGEKVAFLNTHETVNLREDVMFVLGVVNRETTTQKYGFVVEYSTKSPVEQKFLAAGYEQIDKKPQDYVLYLPGPLELEPNEDEFIKILFEPKKGEAFTGQYLYDVYVCTDGTQDVIVNNALCAALGIGTPNLYTGQKYRIYATTN